MRKIFFDESKIIVTGEKTNFDVYWTDIYSATIYQYDCIKYIAKCLCLDFEYGEFIELFEDDFGWNELIGSIHKFLPIEDENWYKNIDFQNLGEDTYEVFKRNS